MVRVGCVLALAISVFPGVVPFAEEPLPAGSPPPVAAVGGFAPAPTCSPGGAPATAPPEPEPPATPFFPALWLSVPALSPRTSGVPSAPGFPSGVAAKLPRRLPTGGSAGGVTEGCRLRAMICPPASAEREPGIAGGGGTTCPPGPPNPVVRAVRVGVPAPEPDPSSNGGGGTTAFPSSPPIPGSVRCAATGNCGAGTITSDRPIFRSPRRLVEAASIEGGGATTADSGPRRARRCPAALASGAGATISTAIDVTERALLSTFGGGATTLCSSPRTPRRAVWTTSGAGATICPGSNGMVKLFRSTAAPGTGTEWLPHATMFGVSTS